MKFGVSSYSFRRLVNEGVLTDFELVAKAKEMGFDALEYAGFMLPEGETALSFAEKIRAEADRVGILLANYTISADMLGGSGGDLAAEIERVRREVDVAEVLGVPGMRHDAAWGSFPGDWTGPKTFAAALPRLAEGCRAVTEYAASKGIRTMVENHGYFCQESLRMEALVNAVAHPNFGLLIDVGNFICADENPAEAVGRLAKSAFHCHAKDFHWKSGAEAPFPKGWFQTRAGNGLRGAIVGHGNMPVRQCVRLLKQAGYDGVFSVEFEGMENPLEGIALGFENLKKMVETA